MIILKMKAAVFLKQTGKIEDSETPKIREATGGELKYAVDCISDGSTPEQTAQAIGDAECELSAINEAKVQRQDARIRANSLFGEDPSGLWQDPLDAAQYNFAQQAVKETLANAPLKPGPVKPMPNGLASVEGGIKEGKVTYRIADTTP